MKTNNLKSPILRLGAFALAAGIGLCNIGCNQDVSKLFFTVKGKDLEVTFCDRGASIYSIKYKDTFVTYHPKDYNTFLTDGYCFGRTLGRVTGRIKDGKLNVEGKDYQLELNETGGSGNKNNSIHGGKNGLPSKNFTRYIHETTNSVNVSFNYVSPHMEAGYPETLDTWVTYSVYKNENKIDTHITATSTGVTPVNITTHPFFRLGNDGDVKDCILEIPADQRAEFVVDANKHTDQVPIGKINVKDTPFDFRGGKAIGKDIEKAKAEDETSGGYDHIWIFNENKQYINLTNPKTNIKLHVDTDADAIIMYANCYPHTNDEMNPSGKDALYSGISVEPYKFFTKDSVSDLNIAPDEPFTRNISYTFSGL